MSALFLVDVLAGRTLRTTRIRQAIESVQSLLSAKRTGELATAHPAFGWSLKDFEEFTAVWAWMGELGNWQSATTAVLFPGWHLDPALLVTGTGTHLDEFFGSIRGTGPFSRAQAEQAAAAYLTSVGLGTVRYLDPARLPAHQADLRDLSKQKRNPVAREIFWAVPMLLAQRLQSAGDYQAALDWYWIVYPYDVGSAESSYDRINTETPFRPDLTFPPRWTAKLDPFGLVANRPTPYSRYTLLSLIRCHLDFADAEFSRETDESVATARTLYLTARRLLGAAALVPQPPTNPGEPALEIPDLTALRARAGVQLTKLRGSRRTSPTSRSGTAPGGSILDYLDYDKQFDLKPPAADLVIDASKLGN